MNKKVSLADIAKSLGVSKTLVSLVINNKGDEHGINAETQRKVRDKIIEMNYQPNIMARGFRTGKTNTIGLIVTDISNSFYSRIARKIEQFAWEKGYIVVTCSTDENVMKEEEQIQSLLNRKVDGLIISTSNDSADFFNKLVLSGFPHVLIDRTLPDMRSVSVSVDNFGGGRMAARHLITQGIKDIAMFVISPNYMSTIQDRIRGFESALSEANINIPPKWFFKTPFHEIEPMVKEGLQSLYMTGDMPEAIFTVNNNLTTICLKYLRKLSMKIPEDIALIGFDDVMYFGFTKPSISVIEQPIDLICEKAFDLLLNQINKAEVPGKERAINLPVNIIIRESSIRPNNATN